MAPKWITKAPEHNGYWWWRENLTDTPQIVGINGGVGTIFGDDESKPARDFGGEWLEDQIRTPHSEAQVPFLFGNWSEADLLQPICKLPEKEREALVARYGIGLKQSPPRPIELIAKHRGVTVAQQWNDEARAVLRLDRMLHPYPHQS